MKVENRLKRRYVLFALSAVLFLFGATNVSALTKNIAVTDVAIKDKSGTVTVEEPVLSDNKITSNVTFNQKDDFVAFELSIKNGESEKYKIESIEDNNTNENIQIEYAYSEDFISTNESGKLTVKLTYKNALINVDKISINDLTIRVFLISEDGKSDEIIINPTTSDALPYYLVIAVAAVAGLVLLAKKKKVKGIKIGGVIIALSVLLIPLAVLAKEKYETQIEFTNIDIIGEFETYNITINPGNGEEAVTIQVQYGDKLESLPTNPSKDGYDFEKWVDGDGNEVTTDTVVTGPMTVEAKYTIKEYNINYDLNGGSLPSGKTNPDKYTILDEVTVNNPEKQGYTFTGWSGTGIDGKTTSLVIPAGSMNDRSYVANYSANTDTPYTVTHRYQNLDDLTTYTESTVTEYGETDKTIPAPRQEKTGFETPAVQNVKVEADGSAHITYTYDRKQILLHINNSQFIVEGNVTGYYPYGSTIHLTAIERPGYTFGWNDGVKTYARDYVLYSTTVLAPGYVANVDTPYVVKHYKQKLTLDGYEIADTQNLTGMTDTPIEPAVNSYTGFKSPAVQHTTIAGDKSTVVNYYYDREMYAFSFNDNENVTSTKPADSYPYETVITLTANTVDGKTFSKWSNNETDNPLTITLTGDLTIEPVYTDNTLTVTFDTGDGSEVASQTVNYGGKATRPTTGPTKDGYAFDNWYTTDSYGTLFDFNTEIVTDTIIYAKFDLMIGTCEDFSADSWATIKTNVNRSPGYYPVGCEKEVEIDMDDDGSLESYTVRVANTSTPELCEVDGFSQTACGTVIEFVDLVNKMAYTPGDTCGTNAGGWAASTIAGWLNRDFYNKLPVELRDIIIPTYPIVSGSGKGVPSPNITQADIGLNKLYLLSTKEVGAYAYFDNRNNGNIYTRRLDYYYDSEHYDRDYDPRRVKSYLTGEEDLWWLRTASNRGDWDYGFVYYGNSSPEYGGGLGYHCASNLNGISPVFRIAKNTYTVTYDANGGAVTNPTKEVTKGSTIGTLPTPETNPNGKTFVEWSTAPTAGVKITSDYQVNDDITIYAIYEDSPTYTITLDANGGTVNTESITVESGESINSLPTPIAPANKEFEGWYTGLTDGYKVAEPFTPSGSITIHARWMDIPFPTVFNQEGACVFNGSDGFITGNDCAYANGENKYIDTGINLYNTENHDKDYEIGFTIVSYNSDENVKQATFMNTKLEGNNYPGVVFRKYDDRNDLDLASRRTTSANSRQTINYADEMTVKIYRITNKTTKVQEIFYSINGGEKNRLNDLSKFNPEFDTSVWFGATPTNTSANVAQRILVGTLSNMYIKLGTYPQEGISSYKVSFDTDGGTFVPTQTISHEQKATRPTTDPTKSDYMFDDWYTDDTYMTKFDFDNTTITSNRTIYARFVSACSTFSTDSWSTIKANLTGNPDYYAAGCEKEVELDMDSDGINESYTVRLANTSTPSECSEDGFSQSACGFVIEFVDMPAMHKMSTTGANTGGWRDSAMRTYVNSEIYNALPSELKSLIVDTTVVSGHGKRSGDETNFITTDKLYLLSETEVGSNGYDTASGNTRALDYYLANNTYADRVKRLNNSPYVWWLRSNGSHIFINTFNFYNCINGSGYETNNYASNAAGVAPAFRIGTN